MIKGLRVKNFMISFLKISDTTVDTYSKKKRGKVYSDTIYTFDIETTSLFNMGDKWDVFDYSKPKEFYQNMDKIAVPYIWQFGIEDSVYYGRDFMDFEKVLLSISDMNLTKIIWVHNLSYEFGFLPCILKKYTIENMTARDIRKPISFHVKELNITFRCSYMLTNMSLERSASEYTNIEKLHTLNYDNKVRLPVTKLSDDEMMYCEYDIRCLYAVLCYYRDKYTHLAKIPLTATGEVRNALREKVDFWYIKKQWDLIPSPKMYLRFMACFQGGYTHANVINSNRVLYSAKKGKIKSKDIASSYPTVMLLEKYPCTPFYRIRKEYFDEMDKDDKCFMFHVKLYEVDSKYYNNYISYSRSVYVDKRDMIYDNGRVKYSHEIELWCTDVDLEIIKANYRIERIEYISIYYAYKDYLDIRVIKFILELYQNKTSLKGVDDKIDLYKKSKSYINSLYGMSVTNPLKNSTEYDGEWFKKEFTMEFVKEVLDDASTSYSTLFYYPVGVWVTAYARKNLYMRIISSHEFDKSVVYCDTDSIKYYGDFDYVFEEYNKNIFEKYKEVCKNFSQLKIDDFMPVDKKGVKHPIGVFEDDGEYEAFITLGAKKYCYTDDTGIHITVSGVSKKGADALTSIEDFKRGFTWDYKQCRKLAHYYSEEQPHVELIDADGNRWINNIDYGVILQPTTYTLGVTEDYLSFIELMEDYEVRK